MNQRNRMLSMLCVTLAGCSGDDSAPAPPSAEPARTAAADLAGAPAAEPATELRVEAERFADVINQELKGLVAAGADLIQIDEPARGPVTVQF